MKLILLIAITVVVANDQLQESDDNQPKGCEIYHLGKADDEDWTPSVDFTDAVSATVKSSLGPWHEFSLGFESQDGSPNGILKFLSNSSVFLTLKNWESTNTGLKEKTRMLPQYMTDEFQLKDWTEISLKRFDEILIITINGKYEMKFHGIDATPFYYVYAHVVSNKFIDVGFNCQALPPIPPPIIKTPDIEKTPTNVPSVYLAKVVESNNAESGGGGGTTAVIIILLLAFVTAGFGFWYWKKKKKGGKDPLDGFLERVVSDKYSKKEEHMENEERTLFLGEQGETQDQEKHAVTNQEGLVNNEESSKDNTDSSMTNLTLSQTEQSAGPLAYENEEKQALLDKDMPSINVDLNEANISKGHKTDLQKEQSITEKEKDDKISTDDEGDYKAETETSSKGESITILPTEEISIIEDNVHKEETIEKNPNADGGNYTGDAKQITEQNDAEQITEQKDAQTSGANQRADLVKGESSSIETIGSEDETDEQPHNNTSLNQKISDNRLHEIESQIILNDTPTKTTAGGIKLENVKTNATSDVTDKAKHEVEEECVQVVISKQGEKDSTCPNITNEKNNVSDYIAVKDQTFLASSQVISENKKTQPMPDNISDDKRIKETLEAPNTISVIAENDSKSSASPDTSPNLTSHTNDNATSKEADVASGNKEESQGSLEKEDNDVSTSVKEDVEGVEKGENPTEEEGNDTKQIGTINKWESETVSSVEKTTIAKDNVHERENERENSFEDEGNNTGDEKLITAQYEAKSSGGKYRTELSKVERFNIENICSENRMDEQSNTNTVLNDETSDNRLHAIESQFILTATSTQTTAGGSKLEHLKTNAIPDVTDETKHAVEEECVQVVISKPVEIDTTCPNITNDMNNKSDYTAVMDQTCLDSLQVICENKETQPMPDNISVDKERLKETLETSNTISIIEDNDSKSSASPDTSPNSTSPINDDITSKGADVAPDNEDESTTDDDYVTPSQGSADEISSEKEDNDASTSAKEDEGVEKEENSTEEGNGKKQTGTISKGESETISPVEEIAIGKDNIRKKETEGEISLEDEGQSTGDEILITEQNEAKNRRGKYRTDLSKERSNIENICSEKGGNEHSDTNMPLNEKNCDNMLRETESQIILTDTPTQVTAGGSKFEHKKTNTISDVINGTKHAVAEVCVQFVKSNPGEKDSTCPHITNGMNKCDCTAAGDQSSLATSLVISENKKTEPMLDKAADVKEKLNETLENPNSNSIIVIDNDLNNSVHPDTNTKTSLTNDIITKNDSVQEETTQGDVCTSATKGPDDKILSEKGYTVVSSRAKENEHDKIDDIIDTGTPYKNNVETNEKSTLANDGADADNNDNSCKNQDPSQTDMKSNRTGQTEVPNENENVTEGEGNNSPSVAQSITDSTEKEKKQKQAKELEDSHTEKTSRVNQVSSQTNSKSEETAQTMVNNEKEKQTMSIENESKSEEKSESEVVADTEQNIMENEGSTPTNIKLNKRAQAEKYLRDGKLKEELENDSQSQAEPKEVKQVVDQTEQKESVIQKNDNGEEPNEVKPEVTVDIIIQENIEIEIVKHITTTEAPTKIVTEHIGEEYEQVEYVSNGADEGLKPVEEECTEVKLGEKVNSFSQNITHKYYTPECRSKASTTPDDATEFCSTTEGTEHSPAHDEITSHNISEDDEIFKTASSEKFCKTLELTDEEKQKADLEANPDEGLKPVEEECTEVKLGEKVNCFSQNITHKYYTPEYRSRASTTPDDATESCSTTEGTEHSPVHDETTASHNISEDDDIVKTASSEQFGKTLELTDAEKQKTDLKAKPELNSNSHNIENYSTILEMNTKCTDASNDIKGITDTSNYKTETNRGLTDEVHITSEANSNHSNPITVPKSTSATSDELKTPSNTSKSTMPKEKEKESPSSDNERHDAVDEGQKVEGVEGGTENSRQIIGNDDQHHEDIGKPTAYEGNSNTYDGQSKETTEFTNEHVAQTTKHEGHIGEHEEQKGHTTGREEHSNKDVPHCNEDKFSNRAKGPSTQTLGLCGDEEGSRADGDDSDTEPVEASKELIKSKTDIDVNADVKPKSVTQSGSTRQKGKRQKQKQKARSRSRKK